VETTHCDGSEALRRALSTSQRECIVLALKNRVKLEMWANANVMVALPKISGALCPTPQSLADADYFTAVQ